MEINISIQKVRDVDSGGILLKDSSTGFLEESATSFEIKKFKKSQLYMIDVVENTTLNEVKFISKYINTLDEEVFIDINFDGWFNVNHIVIPNKEWFDSASESEHRLYPSLYYSDGETIFKYEDGISSETTVDDILLDEKSSTATCIIKDYFSIYYLNECYVKLANNIFNLNTKCPEYTKSELYFNRDLINMTLHVIKYYVDKRDFETAMSTLYKINECNNICSKLEYNDSKYCGCKG